MAYREPHYAVGQLFVRRPKIVFAAQVDAQTFAWSTALQPSGTILYLVPEVASVTYGAYAGSGGAPSTIKQGMLLIAGTRPGLDDLGRCRVINETTVVSGGTWYTVKVWVSNQGTNDGELNISTGSYITILDHYQPWPKKPYIDPTSGDVTKDGFSALFPVELPPIANTGPWYMSVPYTSAPAAVDFDFTESFVTEDGAAISSYAAAFPGATPSTGSSSTESNVSFPADDVWMSLQITDDNSEVHYARALIAVRDGVNAQEGFIDNAEITSHQHGRQGQRYTFRVREALPSGRAYYDELRRNTLTAHYILNEASGSTIIDYSGHEWDATGTSLSTYQELGADGRLAALGLDGSADYVSITTAAFLSAINEDTGAITGMFKVSAAGVWTDSTQRVLFYLDCSTAYVIVRKSTTNNTLQFAVSDKNSNTTNHDHTLSTTDWFNVLVTWDTTAGVKFYVDGVQVGSTGTWESLDSPSDLFIGRSNSATAYWSGDVQHIALIDGALVSNVLEIGIPDTRLANLPKHAAVMYGEREVYNGTVGSLATAGKADREHMKFQGWVERIRDEIDVDGRAVTDLECVDAGGFMAVQQNKPWTYESDAAPTTSGDTAFIHVNKLNLDRAALMLMYFDTTAAEVTDFIWSGTGDDYQYPWFRVNQQTTWEALSVLAQKAGLLAWVDKQGAIRMHADGILAPVEAVTEVASYGSDQATAGGTITASTEYSVQYDHLAFDDLTSTWWSATGYIDEWVKYDFGSTKTIRRVRMYNGATGPKDFRVQYSTNDSDWFTAFTKTGESWAGEWKTYDITADYTARYWRIYVDEGASSPRVAIREIEMMEAATYNTVGSVRSTTIIERLNPWDISRLGYGYGDPERVQWSWGYAVGANTADADTTPTITVYRCVAPGPAPGLGAGVEEYDEQVVATQAELNSREGNRYARANTAWAQLGLDLVWSGDPGWQPHPNEWVRVGLPAAFAAQWGITFPWPEYHETVLTIEPETLIQYLRLNEGYGSTAEDTAPIGNDGYYNEGTVPVAHTFRAYGMDGHRAVEFSGGATGNLVEPYDSVEATGLITDFDTDELTVAAWFKLPEANWDSYSTQRTVVSLGEDVNNRLWIYQSAANALTWAYVAGGTTKSVTKSAISDSDWHHVALTVSVAADEMIAYYDGVQEGSTQTSLGTYVGSLEDGFSYAFYNWPGHGAHLATWSTPLSAANIETLANPDNRWLIMDVRRTYPNTLGQRVSLTLEKELFGVDAHTIS
jgi:hypothetical protein